LLTKGTAWAAILAIPYLAEKETEELVAAAERLKVFTRAQLHDLRTARMNDAKNRKARH